MIARIWCGWASPEQASDYERHFATSVQAELRAVPGFVEARLLRRRAGAEVELIAITTWESMAAMQRFAGEDVERAVVAPEARRLLSRYEDRVTHFEVAFASPSVAERFAVIDHMREAFADVPPEQIQQDVVDIIRELPAERRQILEDMRAPFPGVPPEEIEREAANAIAEVRTDRRSAKKKPRN